VTPRLVPDTNRAWYVCGLRDAVGLPVVLLITTMLGIGGLVRDIGYPAWAGTLSTLLIWAGPAQVILFGAVAAGASLAPTAFAIALSSARFLPMTVSILPWIRGNNASTGKVLFAAHFVSMTTWVEGLRRLPDVPEARRWAYFVGFSTVIIGGGVIATHLGYYVYAMVPKALAAAFLFTTPLFFSAAMVCAARGSWDWVALGIGFFATPVAMHYLPSGIDFLVIGLVGGTLAFVLYKRRTEESGA